MLAALALLAAAVRVVIPVGYMVAPADSSGGFLKLTLCGGSGGVAYLDLQTGAVSLADQGDEEGPLGDPEPSHTHAPCAFASPPPLAAAPTGPRIAGAPWAFASTPQLDRTTIEPGRGLVAPPPWSTGPPPFALT